VEPRAGAPEALSAGAATRFRIRLVAGCLALLGAAMAQTPGFLVADTKFDLAIAPARFLSRALHLWDPSGAFGQLQNQGYGYLWPMGPFFLGGHELGLPGWAVQRLWLALVLVVAFVGAARLARALGLTSDFACLVVGFAFALSPRMLTTLGPISIEAWPSALAPWVLLPLVVGAERGSPRRAAAWSALAVGMVGGVNAAATFAVLPLGVVWLLTRSRGPRRRSLLVWWPVFTACATLWWLVPLFALGAYSPPFLDYIESAGNTTFPTDLVDSLRGVSNWVPYVQANSRAGNDLIRDSTIIVNHAVLLLLGMIGLTLRRNPHRFFLVTSLGVGLFLVTMGHTGSVQGWVAQDLQDALDGVLAPLRNVHKFDVVIRLPLVLGLGWTVDAAVARWRERPAASGRPRAAATVERLYGVLVAGTAAVAVLGAALPVVTGRITPAGATLEVPVYWQQTVDWLDEQEGTALLLPGTTFANYLWGQPGDEPIQALGTGQWAVRNAIPLTPAGNIRMLDAVETWVNQGRGSPALTAYLLRAGVTHLVIRNDLAQAADNTDPVLVHQALDHSPGLVRERSFGPVVGGAAHLEAGVLGRVVVNGGWQDRYPAIEVYRVQGDSAEAREASRTPVVVGGPEDILDLQDLRVLGEEPTVLAVDVDTRSTLPEETPVVLTDGLRAVERNFGKVHDATSAVRGPDEPRRLGNPTGDYLPDGWRRWQTTAELDGVAAISASSSLSDATTSGIVQRGSLPYAALDGEAETAWVSQYVTGDPPWWQVDLEGDRRVDDVTVTAGPDQQARFRVRTEHGTTDDVIVPAGRTRQVIVGDESTGWVRIEEASGGEAAQLSLTEVHIPGVTARRSLVLPDLPDDWPAPARVVLRALSDARTGCVELDDDVRCVPGRAVADEEPLGFRRSFELPRPQAYTPVLQARLLPGEVAGKLLLQGQFVDIDASSEGVPDMRASALAAIDGDTGTTWSAAPGDFRPTLRLSWLGRRSVAGLRMAVDPDADARLPNKVSITWPGGQVEASVGRQGKIRFPAVRTDQLTVRVLEADPATSLDFSSTASDVPVGISELRVRHVPYFPLRPARQPIDLPCGSGPTLVVDGSAYSTSVLAYASDLYAGQAVPVRLCDVDTLELGAGRHQVDVLASEVFTPTSLVLSTGGSARADSMPVAVTERGPVSRSYEVPGDGSLLATTQNTNPGWEASQDGRRLPTQTVDGWRQGWTGASGDDPVEAEFAPDGVYRGGLLAGLLLAFGLVVVVLWRGRRWPGDAPPLGASVAPTALLALLAVGGGGLLAGTAGALVAAGCWLVATLTRRLVDDLAPLLLAAAVLPAVGVFAIRPWGSISGWAGTLSWPQLLVVSAWALAVGWLPPEGRRRGETPRRRWAGRSTSR
jgi:arabinofuranan 3-O-arabinosyltransferase